MVSLRQESFRIKIFPFDLPGLRLLILNAHQIILLCQAFYDQGIVEVEWFQCAQFRGSTYVAFVTLMLIKSSALCNFILIMKHVYNDLILPGILTSQRIGFYNLYYYMMHTMHIHWLYIYYTLRPVLPPPHTMPFFCAVPEDARSDWSHCCCCSRSTALLRLRSLLQANTI